MRRANGDWFALEEHGQLRVPLFHNTQDALIARLRNFGMLLFKPVALDARLLGEIVPAGAGTDVDFCMVNDPFASLSRGSLIERAEVVLLIDEGGRSIGQTTRASPDHRLLREIPSVNT